MVERLTSILEEVGINRSQWIIKVASSENTYLNAIGTQMMFELTEKTKINFRDMPMIFLPKESIHLITFWFHSVNHLQFFIEEHDFFYVDHQEIHTNEYDGKWFFIFAK
jgi:hypothetical protein